MIQRIAVIVLTFGVVLAALVYATGRGWLGEHWGAGTPTQIALPAELVAERAALQRRAARELGSAVPPGAAAKQILFGDLHVHTTFSTDAFMLSLPMSGGDGAHPVSEACDFARFCSALDFWSINDHAVALTPRRWNETVDAIRQCNAVSGEAANPDVVALLGWEWTQFGTGPANHYGHRNVILRDQAEGRIPARPIRAVSPTEDSLSLPSTLGLGVLPWVAGDPSLVDMATYLQEMAAVPGCPEGVPVRELPLDCMEGARTPAELFAKLDDWGHASMVIPHGTSWGIYTPPGASWDKQLSAAQHDPARQRLVEVFSGHGNSEEYRDWVALELDGDGVAVCPEPSSSYLPACWRAGELIRERCMGAGESEAECEGRAVVARRNAAAAGLGVHATVPGSRPDEWLDAGQCRDCFLPSFNHRPRSSAQYMMALSDFASADSRGADPLRFRFGFMASSDNHTARPGTGYKEVARTEMSDARIATFERGIFGRRGAAPEAAPVSQPFDREDPSLGFFGGRETERQASFFHTGGLVAAHARGRDRDAIWEALERREVYGTSGPRILLWFDLLNAPEGEALPMGSETEMAATPRFEVRAVGSFEQRPGCPAHSLTSLSPESLARSCRGECYHPGDRRRLITRIEVVRIRPQAHPGEPVGELIEDPWWVHECEPDLAGCSAIFSDEEFPSAGRDALYYVRAIEAASPTINAGGLRCERDGAGECLAVNACSNMSPGDDCLADSEARAWSSPIFVDFAGPTR
ncbi:MAG: DUF3604 domain-containing protein [Deltaproteobacteria bacterium]|nr:DUF3604 domain-containing protein [Deltaproteobacteria bacterium]